MVLEDYRTLADLEQLIAARQDRRQEDLDSQAQLREQAEALVSCKGYSLLKRIMQDIEVTFLRRAVGGDREELLRAQGAITAINNIVDDVDHYRRGEDEVQVV